ncbi:MAG: diheme cytochrome c [Gammaproteobacteria bacterium]|nr:diheme cytochrome c [Gammaproteobacteria bacterium]MBL6998351.1 diheme cytochrome c [Gammaproteobacteria bacterium]
MKTKLTRVLLIPLLMTGISGSAFSDDDEREHGFFNRMWGGGKSADVAMVDNAKYQQECGSCHFAYQPGLLPARSWTKMMSGLDQHFGENAELPAQDVAQLGAYLEANAADRSDYKRSRKIISSLEASDAPLRITEVPYIIRKHRELSPRMLAENPQVVSLSRCQACHTRAETGSYSESEIKIPGFGRWDD